MQSAPGATAKPTIVACPVSAGENAQIESAAGDGNDEAHVPPGLPPLELLDEDVDDVDVDDDDVDDDDVEVDDDAPPSIGVVVGVVPSELLHAPTTHATPMSVPANLCIARFYGEFDGERKWPLPTFTL